MRISPPLPPVAAPLATLIDPLDPALVVPEVKLNIPLVPDTPASVLLRTIIPLDVAVPSPVAKLMAPPVNGSESPAATTISPPVSVLDLPTLSTILPPRPCVANPVAILTIPDAPLLVVPDEKERLPLIPETPASTVCILMNPLDLATPFPVDRDKEPPEAPLPWPAVNEISPPLAPVVLLPSPAVIPTAPPRLLSAVVSPATIVKSPPL